MCTKIIDNVLDGRAKINHKSIEERIKRLVNYFNYKNVCQNINYSNDKRRLNAFIHIIYQNIHLLK